MRLRGGRPPQPGVATEQSVLAWQLYYVDVFYVSYKINHPKPNSAIMINQDDPVWGKVTKCK